MSAAQYKIAMLASVAALSVSAPVFAQASNASETNSEIVIIGRLQAYRGNISLEELPQATSTIGQETLQKLNITRLDNALALSANISRQNSFGGVFDAYAIRGFVGDPDAGSGYLVNGFNGARGYAGPRDASNIETIEILRGPTSALFGRGEPGGTVNLVTKKPRFEQAGYVSAAYSRFDKVRVEADFTSPLNDIFAFRFTGAYEDGGTYRSTKMDKFSITPSFLMKLDKTTVSYDFEWSNLNVPFDRGVPVLNGNPFAVPSSTYLGEPENDGLLHAEALGHQLQFSQELFGDWKFLAGVSYRFTTFKGNGQDPEFAAARNPILSVPGSTVLSRRRIYRSYVTKDFIPRAEFSGSLMTGGIKHNLMLGADYEWFKLDVIQNRFRPDPLTTALTPAQRAELAAGTPSRATLDAINGIDVLNPVYQAAGTPFRMSPFQSRIETAEAWGVYFRDRIEITDWLAVQGGIRYDKYIQTVEQRIVPSLTRQKVTQWSPSAGLSIKPIEQITLYGSFSKGFRANTGTDVRNTPFRPETAESYEVGVKFDAIPKVLTGTIALFDMKKNNYKTVDPANAGFSLDIGSAKSKGVEVDVNANLPGNLNIVLSYAYTDAYTLTPFTDDFSRTVPAGQPLLNIPKHSATALVSKGFEIGERMLNIGSSVKYNSTRLGETGTTYTLPSYTLVRLFGSVDITRQLELSADVTNLFNEKWIAESYATLWTMPGAPREWTVRARYKF